MELWIRSQDREKLVKVNYFYIIKVDENHFNIVGETVDSGPRIGTYKTKERALEVLEEIEEKIMLLNTFEISGGIDKEKSIQLISVFGEEKLKGLMFPYQMPLE